VVKSVSNGSTQALEKDGAAGRGHEKPNVHRWVAIGLLSGTVLFGCVVWFGTLLR